MHQLADQIDRGLEYDGDLPARADALEAATAALRRRPGTAGAAPGVVNLTDARDLQPGQALVDNHPLTG